MGCSSSHWPSACRWTGHNNLWCMANALLDIQSSSQPQCVTTLWPVPSYTASWHSHTGVSSLPKATVQWCPGRTQSHDLWMVSPILINVIGFNRWSVCMLRGVHELVQGRESLWRSIKEVPFNTTLFSDGTNQLLQAHTTGLYHCPQEFSPRKQSPESLSPGPVSPVLPSYFFSSKCQILLLTTSSKQPINNSVYYPNQKLPTTNVTFSYTKIGDPEWPWTT